MRYELDLGELKGYCNWEIYTQRNKKEKEREVYSSTRSSTGG